MAKTTIIQEFKDFAMRGNVIDMAVGVIIGGAFGKIVTSVVDDLLMPLIGRVLGNTNFSDLYWVLSSDFDYVKDTSLEQARAVGAPVFAYGNFIQNVIDFLIIALCIFMFIKLINSLKKKEAETPAAPPAPSKEEELLTEIRDLLAKK